MMNEIQIHIAAAIEQLELAKGYAGVPGLEARADQLIVAAQRHERFALEAIHAALVSA